MTMETTVVSSQQQHRIWDKVHEIFYMHLDDLEPRIAAAVLTVALVEHLHNFPQITKGSLEKDVRALWQKSLQ